MARIERYHSPTSVRGLCLIHGLRVDQDKVCPQCRERNELTEGDYLREYGVEERTHG